MLQEMLIMGVDSPVIEMEKWKSTDDPYQVSYTVPNQG